MPLFSLDHRALFFIAVGCAVRLFSALYSPVPDCDEIFNFWEPMHFLMHGKGMQTWEYSPNFGLRPYLYVLLHTGVAWLLTLGGLISFKPFVFYSLRFFLGILSLGAETLLSQQLKRYFGELARNLFFVFSIFSAGMFQASIAFLPSSFCMIGFTVAVSAILRGWESRSQTDLWLVVFTSALSVLLGWPFTILLAFLIGVACLVRWNWWVVVRTALLSAIVILSSIVLVDRYYYGKWICSPCNIVLYNVFSTDKGSHLYGVEPVYYYAANLFLNFNISFLLSIAPVGWLFLRGWFMRSGTRKNLMLLLLVSSPIFIWTGVLSRIPHKEERFIQPVYTIIAASAAAFVALLRRDLLESNAKFWRRPFQWAIRGIMIWFLIMSVMRIMGQIQYYRAPLDVYHNLYIRESHFSEGRIVCVGKEWHRFPSSFFLPTQHRLGYVKSKFDGHLPKYFTKTDAIHEDFNDLNEEVMSRYTPVEECDVLVDCDYVDQDEVRYLQDHTHWSFEDYEWFLDKTASRSLSRMFLWPFGWFGNGLQYTPYYVVENIDKKDMTPTK